MGPINNSDYRNHTTRNLWKEEEEAQIHHHHHHHHQSEDTPGVLWRVLYKDLSPVPSATPLERMSVKIDEGVSLRTLTNRISGFLSRSKVVCAYRSGGRIDCHLRAGTGTAGKTFTALPPRHKRNAYHAGAGSLRGMQSADSLLKFVVQLWRNDQDDSSESNSSHGDGGVILEVQRRRGCSLSMSRIRRLLYKFLERNGCPFSLTSEHSNCARKKRKHPTNSSDVFDISSHHLSLATAAATATRIRTTTTTAAVASTMISLPSPDITQVPKTVGLAVRGQQQPITSTLFRKK